MFPLLVTERRASVRCGAPSILDVFPPLNFSVHIRIAPKLMPYRSMASSYSVPTGKSSSVDCQWELNTFGSGFLPSAYDIGRATADQTRASRTISWGRILSVVFFLNKNRRLWYSGVCLWNWIGGCTTEQSIHVHVNLLIPHT
jgi:hypothetical protein